MRNPKDICVSYYHHWQTLQDYESVENFSAFLPFFTGENGFCEFKLLYAFKVVIQSHFPVYPFLGRTIELAITKNKMIKKYSFQSCWMHDDRYTLSVYI